MSDWTSEQSEATYRTADWGEGYFGISAAGVVVVRPQGEGGPAIDLHELTEKILLRGVRAPMLLRFDGILRSRVAELYDAFDQARAEYEYGAPYKLVYPVKVNHYRPVIEGLLAEGRSRGMGLEVGSKPELLAVLTLHGGDGALVVCNGYKDDDYIEMALLSQKLGITSVLVIEKLSELDLILRVSRRLEIEPVIGVRTKLSIEGSGRWQNSAGDRSKFGLTTREIVQIAGRLEEEGMLSCLQLLHFHVGSQITNVRSLKNCLREAAQTFLGLHELGAQVRWMDVGGGLGIDYDGSRTNNDSSRNYSLQEYANDVVWHIGEACNSAGIEKPTILSESGRALTAHHSVLVTEVLGVSDQTSVGIPSAVLEEENEIIREVAETVEIISSENFQESFNDLREIRERAMMFFNVGQLTMRERARFEEFYWRGCEKILRLTRVMEYVPDDLEHLERDMSDTYFLNFSLFQSVPDSWAIQQLFPIVPLHRHDEEPTRRAVLADITCDSDGKVERFVGLHDAKQTLEMHPFDPTKPYYVGFFLVGAYQEILGDLHNLFGDTNVVHIDVDPNGSPRLQNVIRGDRVKEALSYVQYVEHDLLTDLRRQIERSLEEGLLSFEESALLWSRFEAGLHGYTYLLREPKEAASHAAAGTTS